MTRPWPTTCALRARPAPQMRRKREAHVLAERHLSLGSSSGEVGPELRADPDRERLRLGRHLGQSVVRRALGKLYRHFRYVEATFGEENDATAG